MIAVVMIVSGLRLMWRSDRPSRTVVSRKKRLDMVSSSVLRADGVGCAGGDVVADERQEDVFQGRLLLDVLDLGRRKQLLELGEGAVHENPALMQDRDPVGEVLGFVEHLRGEQHRGAVGG